MLRLFISSQPSLPPLCNTHTRRPGSASGEEQPVTVLLFNLKVRGTRTSSRQMSLLAWVPLLAVDRQVGRTSSQNARGYAKRRKRPTGGK